MKNLFSRLAVLLTVFVVAQTVSAFPILSSDALSVYNAQVASDQYSGSRWHAVFTPIRDYGENNTVYTENTETSFVAVEPATTITVESDTSFFVVDDFDSERERVDVAEPSLVALIALGLAGFGLLHRKRDH